MMRIRSTMVAAVVALGAAAHAHAQNFNIDFGQPPVRPQDTYGAAGLPGVWNSVEGEHTPIANPQIVYELVDLDGNPTGVILHQFGGMDLFSATDPSIGGNDSRLLNDGLITFNSILESCLYIEGLVNGTYEVLTYAWMPNHPETLARVRHDFTPGVVDVGGAWSGGHAEGVTYARHLVEVTNGEIGSHSGIVPGGSTEIGAALNGIQLRQLLPCPSDVDESGGVDVDDLVAVIIAWGTNDPDADVDHSGNVDVDDLVQVILNWGPC